MGFQNEIYLQIGENFQLTGMIEPEDANEKGIVYSSANEQIASVNEGGTIIANKQGETTIVASSKENENIKTECKVIVVRKIEESEISFESPLKINGLEVSGINYNENTVLDIKQKIKTNLQIEIVNKDNKILEETDIVGTGCRIRIKENGYILREYSIILYGDVDGDGKITSIDLLVIQRHILQIEQMKEIFRKAGNVSKRGIKPTSVDLLIIQRHILTIQV